VGRHRGLFIVALVVVGIAGAVFVTVRRAPTTAPALAPDRPPRDRP